MSEIPDDEQAFRDDHDPIEDDPEIGPLIAAATQEALEALADHPRKGQIGFCHILWSKKKDILRAKHGIKWRTPREMNPMNFYD